jgi:hypothetical protein
MNQIILFYEDLSQPALATRVVFQVELIKAMKELHI